LSAFKQADEFPMTAENIAAVEAVFDGNWSGSYGGRAWHSIIDAVKMYDDVSPATFIDHAIDLEHNGGNVFDKSTGKYAPVNFDNEGLDDVRGFLNVKFSKDILNFKTHYARVTSKTFTLLTRYGNIVEKIHPFYADYEGFNDYPEPFDVEFEDGTLTVMDSKGGLRCAECECQIDEDDHEHNPSDECICSDCARKYDTCEKCCKLHDKDDLVDVDGDNLCERCAQNVAAKCWFCDEWHENYWVTEDDSEIVCENCRDEHYCEECEKAYSDLKYHKENEHKEETAETIEETKQMVVYKWTPKSTWKSIENVKDTFEGIKSARPYDIILVDYIQKTKKTFTNHENKTITMGVRQVIDGLFIVNLKEYEKVLGNKNYTGKEYGIFTNAGLFFGARDDEWACVDLANRVKDMLDWATLTKESWETTPKETRDNIYSEVKK